MNFQEKFRKDVVEFLLLRREAERCYINNLFSTLFPIERKISQWVKETSDEENDPTKNNLILQLALFRKETKDKIEETETVILNLSKEIAKFREVDIDSLNNVVDLLVYKNKKLLEKESGTIQLKD